MIHSKIKTSFVALTFFTLLGCKDERCNYTVEIHLINGSKKVINIEYEKDADLSIGCASYDCGYSTLTMNGNAVSKYNVIDFKLLKTTCKP